jgi:hypothetical protein
LLMDALVSLMTLLGVIAFDVDMTVAGFLN